MALELGVNIPGGTDQAIKVSANDTSASELINKLISTDGSVTFTEQNDGGFETYDASVSWLNINQTPSSFSGNGLLFVRVNAAETALEFAAAGGAGNTIYNADDTIGAGRTLTLTDTVEFTGGEFGIGTTPTAKVHVRGNGATSATDTAIFEDSAGADILRIRDDKRIIYTDGNEQNGYVLTSDASGIATWQAAAGGGGDLQTTLALGNLSDSEGIIMNDVTAVTNGALLDSDTLTLRAKYDSDPGAGVTATDHDATFIHNMVSASPFSQIDLAINSVDHFTFGNDGRMLMHREHNGAGQTNYLTFSLLDSGSNRHDYARIGGGIISNTNGAEDGYFWIGTSQAGTIIQAVQVDEDGNMGLGNNLSASAFDRMLIEGIGTSSGTYGLSVRDNSATYTLRVRDDGLVAVGPVTPTARLHVEGAGATSSTRAFLVENSSNTDIITAWDNGNVNYGFSTALTDRRVYVNADGFTNAFWVNQNSASGSPVAMKSTITGAATTNTALDLTASGATNNVALDIGGGVVNTVDDTQMGLGTTFSSTAQLVVVQGSNASDRATYTRAKGTSGTNYGLYADAVESSSGDNIAGYFSATNAGAGDAFGLVVDNGKSRFDGDIGFYGTAPISQPDVSGSRGGNAALADLLTELANLGLITDSTTA